MFLSSSSSYAISVAIMVWNGEHHAFVIETYLKDGDSLHGNIPWPTHLPDPLVILFHWGYLKALVFKYRPQTTDELKVLSWNCNND